MLTSLLWVALAAGVVFIIGFFALIINCYKKAVQGEALIRTGFGDAKVSFSGIFVVPVLHKLELMDISLKTIVINRTGKEGLICKDNMRADIKVTFFVRVNKTMEDVVHVAQSVGSQRASNQKSLEDLFDAKFSEALKTVGKRFDFVELYNSREKFKEGILQIIGTDLNGFVLDDCAIDYLEQTPIESLNEKNILDAEGIKKIIDLTARQKVLSNQLEREKEKTLKQQDVEAREAVLELEKQLAETEEKQKREIAIIRSREQSEAEVVLQQEKLKYERARIATEEEVQIARENKDRQIIVAAKNKERTEAIEIERIEKDRMLEATERERVVTLAQIEKERAVEEERRNIQEVIRERVAVQKLVVEEEERINDTKAFAEADRTKAVAIKRAEMVAEESLVQEIKAAEASRNAAEFRAKQTIIDAEAEQSAATKRADAIKIMAEAEAAQTAAIGIGEAKVMEAKAEAMERQGVAEAKMNKDLGLAEAEVIEAKAKATEKQGIAEASVMQQKLAAEAQGITDKAEAMKKMDGVGKEHEEFKLRLEKDKAIELAGIDIQAKIAASQATVLGEALKSAKIDIVGGETMFFDQIVSSITKGKSVDAAIGNSKVLTDVKRTLIGNSQHGELTQNLRHLVGQFGLNTEDVKNLSIASVILKLSQLTDSTETKSLLENMLSTAKKSGVENKSMESLSLN